MDNNPDRNNDPQSQIPDWFQTEINSSQPTGTPGYSKKLFVIIALAISLIVISVAGFFSYQYLERLACLDQSDYEALTGQSAFKEFSPKNNFYTYSLSYDSSSQSTDSSDSSAITSIAKFYSTHKNKSLQITIASDYSSDDNSSIAAARVSSIKQALIKSGLPESILTTKSPDLIDIEEDSATEIATIALSSSMTCR